MFRNWLKNHKLEEIAFDAPLFEKAENCAFWQKHLSEAQLREAEVYLGYEWPLIRATQYMAFHQEGNRLAQETPHLARRKALMALFLGELYEGKGRFLPDLTDGIFAVCEESYWGFSAHADFQHRGDLLPCAEDPYIDLFAAETAEVLSVIYYVLGDRLREFCQPILSRIEYELERRIIDPYLQHCGFRWMGYQKKTVNNWNPWILSNLVTVFVCTPVTKRKFSLGIIKMFEEIQHYYDTIPEDGGCDEGTVYWTKAGGMLFAFCDVLYRTSGGKVDLFHDEKLRKMALYVAAAYIGDCRFVNYGDGLGWIKDANLDYVLYGFGTRLGEEGLCRLAGELYRNQVRTGDTKIRGINAKNTLFSFIMKEEIAACKHFEPKDFYFLPKLQNAYLRKGEWFLGAKGGHNGESHNHNDVGSFLLYYGAKPVLVDPGIGTYTKTTFSAQRYTLPGTQSFYHNLPVIGGFGQMHGSGYRADRFEADGDRVGISFPKAYDESAGVIKMDREIRLTEEGIRLSDEIETKKPCPIEERFMTPLEVRIQGDAAILGDEFILCAKGCSITLDRMDFEGDEKYLSSWECDGLWRISIHTEAKAEITLRRL